MLKIINSVGSATENMEKDVDLLKNLEIPTLHFYEFKKKSITFGYFVDIEKFLDIDKLKDIDIAKRPTGGGIVFHEFDMAFSFLMPSDNKNFFLDPLKNYNFVNNIVKDAIEEFFLIKGLYLLDDKEHTKTSFCMATPTKYDILYKNRKVAGAAQRRKKNGYLHQQTIAMHFPNLENIKKLLVGNTKILEYLSRFTYPLAKGRVDIDKFKKVLVKHFKKAL